MNYLCPVCGYWLEDPPTRHRICPCCGTEFGYHDSGGTYDDIRKAWVATGARWWSPVDRQPVGWNAVTQLLNAGFDFNMKAQISQSIQSAMISRIGVQGRAA
jgi:predicted amidophosphoribosyltransferase